MNNLTTFFIGVAIALIAVLVITYFVGGVVKFNSALIFVAGFVIGMLTLYIKVKLLGF